jgi:hypothetical protein
VSLYEYPLIIDDEEPEDTFMCPGCGVWLDEDEGYGPEDSGLSMGRCCGGCYSEARYQQVVLDSTRELQVLRQLARELEARVRELEEEVWKYKGYYDAYYK